MRDSASDVSPIGFSTGTGPRRFTLLLLERGRLSIRTKARHSNAHHSRPYDRRRVEKSQMPTELRQKRRRRTEGYRRKPHGCEPQRNHQGIRRTVRVRMVHQARCAMDARSGQINEPVPCRSHTHGRKKVDQLQERDQRENRRVICRHLQIFNSVVRAAIAPAWNNRNIEAIFKA